MAGRFLERIFIKLYIKFTALADQIVENHLVHPSFRQLFGIIIITIYFENILKTLAYFHAKIGLDVCPRVNNHLSVTLVELTRQVNSSS